jgi:uncharacterized protein YecE (DUF72 family)
LERYATRFSAAEINSTFHRSHKPQTLTRWAASVPDDFRFAAKLPKKISHELRHGRRPLQFLGGDSFRVASDG